MAARADREANPQLPAPSPDLVVATSDGGDFRVLRISPQLARLAAVSPEEARSRFLHRLFGDATPPLAELAREALSRDEPLRDIHVRFSAENGLTLAAEVHPGGLTEDFRRRLVTFAFKRPVSADAVAFHGLIGAGSGMREVRRKIGLYARSDAAVVVTGETGTGKELVARALHDESERRSGPYIAVNCSAISLELLESELFGHEKGAFTGAVRTHRGRFERAHRGTLFLDEIGDMPLHTQAKLLRVLETGAIERVGAEEERQVDVRIVGATNLPLEHAVGQRRFRADLYHRLCVLRIHMPALRQRTEDIPQLVEHFLHIFNRRYGRRIERLTPEALALLQSYLWPGNVRELRNVLERVYVETQAEVIGARAFREWIRERQDFSPGAWGLEALERAGATPVIPPYPPEQRLLPPGGGGLLDAEIVPPAERRTTRPAELDPDEIRRAWQAADGNLSAAARLLGVHRATLYRYLDKLGLTRGKLERS
ncbi:MAG: sigma 54-interacting transcriptional regulator [Desulfuromonadales bacterium]